MEVAEACGSALESTPGIISDAHCERAKAAGTAIVYAIRDEDYGGRAYSCCDPESHLWSFGTYAPWARS